MIKKVGIVTYQNGKNYGGFLQAYSLQKILETNKDVKVDKIRKKHRNKALRKAQGINELK